MSAEPSATAEETQLKRDGHRETAALEIEETLAQATATFQRPSGSPVAPKYVRRGVLQRPIDPTPPKKPQFSWVFCSSATVEAQEMAG
jgi:hypothetical protein